MITAYSRILAAIIIICIIIYGILGLVIWNRGQITTDVHLLAKSVFVLTGKMDTAYFLNKIRVYYMAADI
jgi:hypothetical protein